MSSTTDLTAFVLVFPPADEDDKYTILPYFWLPEDTIPLKARHDHVPYDLWEKHGQVETTEGNVVHYGHRFKDMSPPTKELMKLTLEQKSHMADILFYVGTWIISSYELTQQAISKLIKKNQRRKLMERLRPLWHWTEPFVVGMRIQKVCIMSVGYCLSRT